MSTFVSAIVRLQPNIASLYRQLTQEADAVVRGLSSERAGALADELCSLPPQQSIQSSPAWDLVNSEAPAWRNLLPAQDVAALDRGDLAAGDLGAAFDRLSVSLAREERLLVAEASVDALRELGCAINRVDGERTSAIEATRGHETFLVVVQDEGAVVTDHAGLADGSCTDRQRDFVEAMSRRGVLFDDQATVQHHDPRGGAPIANAHRAGGASLAHGAVLHGDGSSGARERAAQRGARRRARVAEGGSR